MTPARLCIAQQRATSFQIYNESLLPQLTVQFIDLQGCVLVCVQVCLFACAEGS